MARPPPRPSSLNGVHLTALNPDWHPQFQAEGQESPLLALRLPS